MEIIIKAGQLILSLSLLVVLHELGHFIPAKLFKTKVEKFFLFFDVKFALFKKKIGETVYGIGWLPLGGYVKIAGMIDESMDKEQMAKPPQPWEFRSKPAWQRLIIMIGGVVVNIIVGFVIYIGILFFWGSNEVQEKDIPSGYYVSNTLKSYGFQNGDIPLEVNGKPITDTYKVGRHLLFRNVQNITVKHQNGQIETLAVSDSIGNQLFHSGELNAFRPFRKAIIDSVMTDAPAFKSGILKGDKILSIENEPITYFEDIETVLSKNQDKTTINIEISRNGENKIIPISPEKGKLGVIGLQLVDYKTTHIAYSLTEAISKGINYGYWVLRDFVAQFKYVFTKKGASQLGGIGAMSKMFSPEWDWQRFWESTAIISIMLAFMNILPIPALDGGHVVFLLYEIITRRKPNEKVLEYAQMIGIFLLLGLMIFANGNDIYRWIMGN